MAAPWIKWSKGLTLKREVLLLAAELHRDVHEIAGRLMRFWEWLDDNVTSDQVDENGNARVTLGALPLALVDSISGVTGFGEALTRVHWLTVDGGDLVVVNFGRHNGETAKTRSLTAVRVAKHKTKKSSGNAVGNGVGNAAVTVDALPREEKIREELNTDTDASEIEESHDESPVASKRFTPPTVEEVREHCRSRNSHVDAEQFVAHYEARGWMAGKSKIKNWKACIVTWERRDQEQGHGKTQQPMQRQRNLLPADTPVDPLSLAKWKQQKEEADRARAEAKARAVAEVAAEEAARLAGQGV